MLLGGGLLFWYHYITSCQSTHAAVGIMPDSLHFVSAAAWQGVMNIQIGADRWLAIDQAQNGAI